MGVKNLWDILESCKKTMPLTHLQNKRLCIDLSCWMVQLQTVTKSHGCTKERVYLRGLFHRLRALIALNCSLVFVTDGSIPAIKLASYRRRLNLLKEVNKDDANVQNPGSMRRNMGSEFSRMVKEAKNLGLSLGIPCLDGLEEAEAQCALLNSESLCDGCFSSDSDIFLFGAETVYRDICLGDGGYVVCYEMADIKRHLGFGRNSLIALAVLLGSDYSQGIRGFGLESACRVLKVAGDDEILQKIVSGGMPFLKETKASKKQQPKSKITNKENSFDGVGPDSEMNDHFLRVIDAYLKPKCHSADSEIVLQAFAQLPFQRIKLQELCSQYFEWPPEKTDEYILPKIAERDLRRFANLRSTAAKAGVDLPLQQIPVKCPVSRVIKPRKVHGVACYEVSWDHWVCLGSSVILADLLKSACPERILDYENDLALRKKQNNRKSRRRKPEHVPLAPELDEKLQQLLLEIDSGSTSNIRRTCPTADSAEPINQGSAMSIDLCNGGSLVKNKADGGCTACSKVGPSTVEELIDLSSPSPSLEVLPSVIRNCSQLNGGRNCMQDIISLSDSDMEVSPEHAKKARELRLFISGLKE
ncbi:hypothetical protein MLD38_033549 [Melastoma candidum]|uniref:Uncharacterized protein n=1 Tax=Melastoma candidum TaxID=119954 RepID=A0ACB9M748_9MYRT|nr:hypothetical protein MLD38_033549 [Melastoma candidum]